MLAGSPVAHTFVTVTYRAPQTVEYLMPAYLPVAAAAGLLPALLPHSRAATLLCSLILVAGLLNGWSHVPSFFELAQDRTARETVEPLLDTAPSGALLLADWRWVMPLRYLREVEGQRPDVELQYVWPVAGEDYRDVWLERVQDAGPERPILVALVKEKVQIGVAPASMQDLDRWAGPVQQHVGSGQCRHHARGQFPCWL